ncbi:MAG: cupin domain-containing protein [Chlamydiales bacterium]|nr:cupin domain-containing protein [Chlamydiales bacterium]
MVASHLFHLGKLEPQNKVTGGTRVRATKSNFPALQGMSFYKLILSPRAIREPHWHANADELGVCLKGKALISLYATGNVHSTFIVNAGDAFHVPSGTLHGIENIGEDNCELILEFSHEEPIDFGLSSAFGMFSDAVLGNTWDTPGTTFHAMPRSTKEVFIAIKDTVTHVPQEASYASAYHYNLDKSSPLVANEGGSAKVARKNVWPILKHQAVYSLILTGIGMREPHWHPETAELGYVHQGRGRMSILSPDGTIDSYEINEGDIYFIPKAYPHHIENLTDNPLHLLIFFDQAMPADIGFTASVKSYSDEVLTAVLKGPKELFKHLPRYYEDLLIVKKVNP